jgi:tRNA1Val (adenine37-N6)-methyltransferase
LANPYFKFKQFTVFHERTAMKVTTDACLFGAWCAEEIKKEVQQNCFLLDIGTGTALLSLMIAQKNDSIIDAVEIDENAAQQALENTNGSPWKERIKVHHSDILNFTDRQYDVIISNPPFYENELQSANQRKNQAHHGTDLKLADLFYFIKNQLSPAGKFYLLLPYKRMTESEILMGKEKLFVEQKIIVATSPLHSPFRIMIKGSRKTEAAQEKYFFINSQQQEYSNEFISLLKDYYLYL